MAGTQANPWQVATYDDLKKVGCEDTSGDYEGWDLDSYYIQTADIQCPTGEEQDNFPPIGEDSDGNRFTGDYNGNNKKIKDLYLSYTTTDYTALFRATGTGASIYDLSLIDVDSNDGDGRVGSILGMVHGGTYTNLYASGAVTNTGLNGRAGGLVAWVASGTFSDCISEVVVDSNDGNNVGGFAGYLAGSADNCYATGNVDSNGGDYVGGFAGYLAGSADNCYATGNVTSSSHGVGGFTGRNYRSPITNCYSTGEPTGTSDVGGFCGSVNTGGDYADNDNYWDTETSKMETSQMGTGKTTNEMQTLDTFTPAWDITDVETENSRDTEYTWNIVDRDDAETEQSYPFLSWEAVPFTTTTNKYPMTVEAGVLNTVNTFPIIVKGGLQTEGSYPIIVTGGLIVTTGFPVYIESAVTGVARTYPIEVRVGIRRVNKHPVVIRGGLSYSKGFPVILSGGLSTATNYPIKLRGGLIREEGFPILVDVGIRRVNKHPIVVEAWVPFPHSLLTHSAKLRTMIPTNVKRVKFDYTAQAWQEAKAAPEAEKPEESKFVKIGQAGLTKTYKEGED